MHQREEAAAARWGGGGRAHPPVTHHRPPPPSEDASGGASTARAGGWGRGGGATGPARPQRAPSPSQQHLQRADRQSARAVASRRWTAHPPVPRPRLRRRVRLPRSPTYRPSLRRPLPRHLGPSLRLRSCGSRRFPARCGGAGRWVRGWVGIGPPPPCRFGAGVAVGCVVKPAAPSTRWGAGAGGWVRGNPEVGASGGSRAPAWGGGPVGKGPPSGGPASPIFPRPSLAEVGAEAGRRGVGPWAGRDRDERGSAAPGGGRCAPSLRGSGLCRKCQDAYRVLLLS